MRPGDGFEASFGQTLIDLQLAAAIFAMSVLVRAAAISYSMGTPGKWSPESRREIPIEPTHYRLDFLVTFTR